VHLGLAAKTLDVGLKVTLVGTDGTPKRVVILESGTETEWKNCRKFETVRDYTGMIFGCLLVQPGIIFGAVLGDDDGQITGWK
jgi:hypothetical protein